MKVKYLILYIYLVILVISTKCEEECATPAECYLKAIATLKQDREEMRRVIDSMQTKLDEANRKYEILSSTLAENETRLKTIEMDSTKNKTNDLQVQELSTSSEAPELNCISVKSGSRVTPCYTGYTTVGCNCGSSCNNWEIDMSGKFCNCKCGDISTAICCKIVLK
jgi:hypothetical protein